MRSFKKAIQKFNKFNCKCNKNSLEAIARDTKLNKVMFK